MAKAQARTKKKKEKKNIPVGVAHIKATFNNTLVTITDPTGNVVSWSSAGTPRLQGLPEGHAFCGPIGGAGCGPKGHGPWHAECRCLCQRAGCRPGSCAQSLAGRGLKR